MILFQTKLTCILRELEKFELLSDPIPRRTVYTHLGWVLHDGRCWFLHAGGAVGADGAVIWNTGPDGRPVAKFHQFPRIGTAGPVVPVPAPETVSITMGVRAPESLERFRLPVPPQGEALIAAVRRSLELADLAPDSLTFPLLAAAYRAPLGDANYSISLDGVTGLGKTTLAALFQQHFGPELDYEHLPAGFDSTANYLEALTFPSSGSPSASSWPSASCSRSAAGTRSASTPRAAATTPSVSTSRR